MSADTLHFVAAALAVASLVLIPGPLASFFVLTVLGLHRVQVRRNAYGAWFRNGSIYIWRVLKIVEGVSWGIGAGVVYCVLWLVVN